METCLVASAGDEAQKNSGAVSKRLPTRENAFQLSTFDVCTASAVIDANASLHLTGHFC